MKTNKAALLGNPSASCLIAHALQTSDQTHAPGVGSTLHRAALTDDPPAGVFGTRCAKWWRPMKTLATVIAAGMFLLAGGGMPCAAQLALAEESSDKILAELVSNDDPDGDGWTNFQEFLLGTNPRDYYNGETPCLDTLRFGHYVGVVSNYLVLPFSAQVNGPYGVRTNAPVVFGVPDGKARFLAGTKENQTFSDHVWVRSDTNGQATAWLLLPVDFHLTNLLTITAGTGTNAVTAQVAGWLEDFSGTGQLVTNTNKLPMPLALEARMHWLNRRQMPNCQPQFEMFSFIADGSNYLDTNLFLFPDGHTNDTMYLTLVNTATNTTYQLAWKFDLNIETAWHPGEIITGNGTNVEFTPVPAYGHSNMFFAVVTNGATTVRIAKADGSADGLEPYSPNSDEGISVLLNVYRTGPTNADLLVYFNRSGSATFSNDYVLTNDAGTVNYTNVVTIPANATNVTFWMGPVDDEGLNEFDESVVIALVTDGHYLVDLPNRYVHMLITNSPQMSFFATVTNLPAPDGIDYHPVSNALVVSVNRGTTDLTNFMMLSTNVAGELIATNWSGIQNLSNEVKLTIVKATTNGFTAGEMFFSNGTNGIVGKLSADGTVSNLSWAVLNNDPDGVSTLLRGSLHVDQTGLFSNNLIVVTGGAENEGGEVWMIGSTTNGLMTNATLLADLTALNFPHLEGVLTLTNDPLKYGPWAGKLITGAEAGQPPRFNVITPTGDELTYFFGISPEDFDVIPLNEPFYVLSGESEVLLKLDSSLLTNHVGDLMVTQEFDGGKLFILHWDQTNFLHYGTRINLNGFNAFEHGTFAPVNLPVP